jgi:hypothetical protein
VGEEYVPPVPVDTTLTLRRMILERKADFVWTNGTESTLLPLLRDAVRLGLREKVGWGGTCFLDLPDMFQSARKDPTIAKGLEGLVIPFIYRQFEEVDCPGVKFMIELSKKYRGGLPSEDMRGEYIHGVSSGMVTAEVLRLVAEKVPVEKITKDDIEPYGWWRMKDYDNMGLFGGATLTFGKDLPRIGISLRSGTHPLQIIGGEITRLKDTLYPKVFLK